MLTPWTFMTATNIVAPATGIANKPAPKAAGILDLLDRNARLLVAVGVIAAYLPRLMRSLWVDEAGTYWMACKGPLAAIQRTSHWPGQSILFAVITSFFCIDESPLRDMLLRAPALLGAAAACYFVYRFAEDAIGTGAGCIAAVLFAFSPVTIEFAPQARPYALAMAAVAASCWTLYRWGQSRERSWLIGYVVSSVLVIYLHYLFCAIFAVHAVFLMYEFVVNRRLSRSSELLAGYFVLGLAATPLLKHILLLAHQAHTLPFRPKPSGLDLAGILIPPLYIVSAFGLALLVHLARPDRTPSAVRPSRGMLAMFLSWWVLGPVFLFATTSATTMQIFSERYVAYSGLGLVLLLTYSAYYAFGPRTASTWALALATFITAGNVLMLAGPPHPDLQELGPFMRVIRDESANTTSELPPVLFQSALVESNFYDWRSGDSPTSYLYAPFAAYPMKNKLLPLPMALTPEVKDHVSYLLQSDLKRATKVLFVPHDFAWVTWFTARFEQAGFRYRFIRLNAYWVIVFERAGTA
jgi:Dolichyl-phosphate-mannose-protein mannosyltransferase